MITQQNRRVLLVDDLPAIHDDFRKVLAPAAPPADLAEDEALLFGAPLPASQGLVFEMDSAFQGAEALAKVRAARAAGTPYAMAFIDVRMPPGWDGIETVERLWEEDPELQVVLCTAYSDHSWPAVLARLNVRDRLLILKKPFDPIEVYQFASALTTKWNLSRLAAFEMDRLEQAVEERTRDLSNANIIVQNSPVILYRLRGEPALPLIYISHNIVRLGHDRSELMQHADWAHRLIHPDDLPEVGAAMARIFEKDATGASIEFRMLDAQGQPRWVENRYIPVRDGDGALVEIEGIVIDISERKAAEEQIASLARTDSLTGLANRGTFMERLQQLFAATRRGAVPFAVLYLDLDRFKPVNDTLGHAIGDRLLQEVARRLRSCTRDTDLVARLGGDEFAILQGMVAEPAQAGELAEKIVAALAAPYVIDAHGIRISVSIGVSHFAPEIESSQMLLAQADVALYRAKEEGRSQFRFHSAALDQQILDRSQLAAQLREAVAKDQLEVVYQPQVELSSGAILGMEALVRWHHPVRGLLAAETFISLAEQIGVVVPLGRWVLNQACRQMRAWRDAQLPLPVMAVNLSLAQLARGTGLVEEVRACLAKWNLVATDLEFDVTERTLARLKWTDNDILARLNELGVKIAIDDFGTAYSSFDYVRSYHINHLKISRACVARSTTDPRSAATLRAIVSFARDIGVEVIAQGVESEQQCALLGAVKPDAPAQGYHFSAPVVAAEAEQLLRAGTVKHERA
jgi:diguanylate cyclase (GGDEF)-like protein/PAS domain S-box-containing protein